MYWTPEKLRTLLKEVDRLAATQKVQWTVKTKTIIVKHCLN